jgi:hypothetical protein
MISAKSHRRPRHRNARQNYLKKSPLLCPLAVEQLEERRLLDAATPHAVELVETSPALFVENQGQWADESVRFLHSSDGASVAMTDTGPVFQVRREKAPEGGNQDKSEGNLPNNSGKLSDRTEYETESLSFSASFVGSNEIIPTGLDLTETRFNYFVGDQSHWRSDVRGYEVVTYEGIYDGIDLHTWGQRDSLKYELHVAPSVDYTQIAVQYDGIAGLALEDNGSLTVNLVDDWGQWFDDAPYIYQVIDGKEVEVAGRFKLLDNKSYSFVVTGEYDANYSLIIDPDLAWSTYLDGAHRDDEAGVATDGAGNVFVTMSDDGDALVVKLSPSGNHLWSTYLGG